MISLFTLKYRVGIPIPKVFYITLDNLSILVENKYNIEVEGLQYKLELSEWMEIKQRVFLIIRKVGNQYVYNVSCILYKGERIKDLLNGEISTSFIDHSEFYMNYTKLERLLKNKEDRERLNKEYEEGRESRLRKILDRLNIAD